MTTATEYQVNLLKVAEHNVEHAKRLWHMASPERRNEAYARYLAQLDWLDSLVERKTAEGVTRDGLCAARPV